MKRKPQPLPEAPIQETPPDLDVIKRSDLARALGISRSRVTQLVNQGLPTNADGTVSLAAAIKYIQTFLSEKGAHNGSAFEGARRLMARASGPAAQSKSEAAPPSALSPSPDIAFERDLSDPSAAIAAERILSRPNGPENRLEAEFCDAVYRARLRQLEFHRAADEVVAVADVAAAIGGELAVVRTRLLALPSQIAPALARLKTAGVIEAALRDAITEVLEALTVDTPTPAPEIFKRIQDHNDKH